MASTTGSNINSITFNQLSQLPHQISKCPTSIQKIDVVDHKTGLAPNEYLSAEWNAQEKHSMMNVPLRIKETEVKTVTISDGGSRMVTNIIARMTGFLMFTYEDGSHTPKNFLNCSRDQFISFQIFTFENPEHLCMETLDICLDLITGRVCG